MASNIFSEAIQEYLSRRGASDFLKAHGYPVAVATLATLVTRGGGPTMRKFGPRVLYRPDDLLEWAQSRLSPPHCSSSQNNGKAE